MNTADKTAIEMASYQDDVSIMITLDQPIPMGDQSITQVLVRKPTSGALMDISLTKLLNEADYPTIVKLVSRCTTPQISALHFKNDLVSLSDMTRMHGELCAFFLKKKDRDALPRIE